ncbi:hypothetical protein [Actinomadura latina]|uniref:hypothetical protein n=1 Tax=Actinomadura latina TaxID=163603 RepID=UPI00082E5FC1|nr:hypothetical protein [Actinomadura latina]
MDRASEAVRCENPRPRVRFSQATISSGLVKVFTGRSPNAGRMWWSIRYRYLSSVVGSMS